ncbi:lateral tail fiber protein [Escherichia phage IsaakIselin]|uniref:Lateral tail fiber protein n=1 Tax=Escherichia phage IsaakIselin TaxID=2851974 RepID=A0AAE7VTX3_9CAUD|nr:lateral tail fiber protein [Escherichia phage IsaakIselin]
MAIYRTGQASMDANGYITGYGTKWKTALTLIRPGATIVFASNPVAYATISEIVNDTSLRATSTGGAVVPRGDYVILLHDSLTVDGLAQDVAETLRYYQGQETMYQEFVDFLKSFDWQKLEQLERNTEANAAAADASAKSAKSSETNAASSASAANTAKNEAQTAASSANASKSAAAASATTATQQADRAKSEADRAQTANPDNQLKKANNLSDVADKPTSRENLGLGKSSTVEFGNAITANGYLIRTPSNANNDNPSAAFAAQLMSGSTILSQAEFRADRNQNISIINRSNQNSPQFASLSPTGDFSVPNLVASMGVEANQLELGYRTKNSTAYIDLHYSGKYDYDARIYCDGMNRDANGGGNLRFTAGYMSANIAGGYLFNGGRLTIETSDINLRTKLYTSWDADSFVVRPRTAGNSHYIMFNDLNKNTGWVGNPSNNDDSIGLWSYVHKKGIQISDRIRLNGGDTNCQGNLFVDGSSAYVRGGDGSDNTHVWLQNRSGRNRAVIYSNDTQVLQLRSDNASTGAGGQALSIYGATGECKAVKFTATSDERAKFWIKPVTGALDKICSLRGVTYSMHTTIQNTVRNAGVIAQDVQKVLPEAVSVTEGKDHNVLTKNCDKVENPLTLDYNALSALYVEAFKEMRDLIDAQKAEIEALKADIVMLKNK